MTNDQKHAHLLQTGWHATVRGRLWYYKPGDPETEFKSLNEAFGSVAAPYPEYQEDLQLLQDLPSREWIPLYGGNMVKAPGPTWEDTKALSRLLLHLLESR